MSEFEREVLSIKAAKNQAGATVPGRKKGASTIKTPELLDAIFAGISLGKSARAMCVEVGISQRVLWNWLACDEDLMRQYLRAKELCVDAYAEEIIEIIDARKWYAARLAPRKYGDKLPVTHEAGDTKKQAIQSVEVTFVSTTDVGKQVI